MSIREQIRQALSLSASDARQLHARHVNPTFIEALELFGFGRDFVKAEGLSLWDHEGHEVLDFLAGYGAVSLGHNHPDVRAAIEEVLQARAPHFLLVSPQRLAAALAIFAPSAPAAPRPSRAPSSWPVRRRAGRASSPRTAATTGRPSVLSP